MADTVTAAVILIGDELLSGRTQDSNLKTIAEFLNPLGVEVREAEDGAQALEIVRKSLPAVAIVDVHMPGMDGLSFTREVRGDAKLAGLPIVLLTGEANAELREKGRLAGATDFLGKPLKGPELQAMVKRFLGTAA